MSTADVVALCVAGVLLVAVLTLLVVVSVTGGGSVDCVAFGTAHP